MIELTELNFGDVVYVVHETNNSFVKQKISMIDADGVEWHRYDRDHWEYRIEEYTYCGKVTWVEEGNVRFDEDRIDEYHFKHPNGQIYPETEPAWPEDFKDWFYTKEEAEKYIQNLKESRVYD